MEMISATVPPVPGNSNDVTVTGPGHSRGFKSSPTNSWHGPGPSLSAGGMQRQVVPVSDLGGQGGLARFLLQVVVHASARPRQPQMIYYIVVYIPPFIPTHISSLLTDLKSCQRDEASNFIFAI